jgi:hypothetical protein
MGERTFGDKIIFVFAFNSSIGNVLGYRLSFFRGKKIRETQLKRRGGIAFARATMAQTSTAPVVVKKAANKPIVVL